MATNKKKRKQETYNCLAYPFPHRLNGGKCEGGWVCEHGFLTPDHPDWDGENCGLCADEAYADRVSDIWKEEKAFGEKSKSVRKK